MFCCVLLRVIMEQKNNKKPIIFADDFKRVIEREWLFAIFFVNNINNIKIERERERDDWIEIPWNETLVSIYIIFFKGLKLLGMYEGLHLYQSNKFWSKSDYLHSNKSIFLFPFPYFTSSSPSQIQYLYSW